MHAVLAKRYAALLLSAAGAGDSEAETSLDLGRTRVTVEIARGGVRLPGGSEMSWSTVATIARKDDNCYLVDGGEAQPIQRFSARLNRSYTLRATAGAPTMLISGIPMHRIKGITPDADTAAKIAAAAPLGAQVLDTATGLGYTAIAAAATGAHVTTIELDPAVIDLCRLNPWSQELFGTSAIEHRIGSSFDLIRTLETGRFDTVVHDPPTFSLAGELYSGEFYRQVFRVLSPRGSLFHYLGDLESRSVRSVAKGAIRRLQDAGFVRIVRHPEAFGIVAFKNRGRF